MRKLMVGLLLAMATTLSVAAEPLAGGILLAKRDRQEERDHQREREPRNEPRRERRLEQAELHPVTLGIDAHIRQDLSAIDLRADIVAAADHEAMQRLRRRRMARHETDGARSGAVESQSVHEVATPSAAPGRGDADQGTCHDRMNCSTTLAQLLSSPSNDR